MKNIKYEVLTAIYPLLTKYGSEVVLDNVLEVTTDLVGKREGTGGRKTTIKTVPGQSATSKGGPLYEHFKCSQRIKDLLGHAAQVGIETTPYIKFTQAKTYKPMKLDDMLATETELRKRMGKPRIIQPDRS